MMLITSVNVPLNWCLQLVEKNHLFFSKGGKKSILFSCLLYFTIPICIQYKAIKCDFLLQSMLWSVYCRGEYDSAESDHNFHTSSGPQFNWKNSYFLRLLPFLCGIVRWFILLLLCFIKLKMIKKLNRGILLLFNFRPGNVWPWEHLPPLPLVHFIHPQVRFSVSFTLSFSLRYHSVFPLFVCLTVEEREFTAHILLYITAPLQSHPEFSTRLIIMFSHYCLSVLSFSHSSICTLWILCCMLTERRWERWLLNSCQTCRCDLDHPWGEEAVVNLTIMPWQLYKFCCNTDVKYSRDIWWDMTNNCDFL